MVDPIDVNAPHDPWAYDPLVDDMDDRIERLARVLDWQQATAIVAIVEEFNVSAEGVATVTATPCINARQNGVPVQYPPHPVVPVLYPSGGGRSFTWPLQKGDYVLLVYNMRSIDEWRERGGQNITPLDFRRFSLSDAVAIPGLRPDVAPLKGTLDNAMRWGGDRYSDPEGTGVLANFRESADVIELVVSSRMDGEEELPDRLVRINKSTGKVTLGEVGRGVVLADDATTITDGDASVTVKPGEVEATVGDLTIKLDNSGAEMRLDASPDVVVQLSSGGKVRLGEVSTVTPLLGPAEVSTVIADLLTALTADAIDPVDKADLVARMARIKP